MEWYSAPDIKRAIKNIITSLSMTYIDRRRVICFRSSGSTSRARARIWSLPRVWQKALKVPAYYILEVISEKFDKLSKEDQDRVLIHELLHIPKNFSGSLLPHRGRGKKIDNILVEKLFQEAKINK
ncbi:MAG: metallopeptidase [Microgenomates group bacterium LiPW_16]|nr:MAG: metallopeptidase [Microgenomates group bacterium LiPW_16]